MVWGAVLEKFNGNNVKFFIDDVVNPLEEVIFVRRLRMIKDLPINRTTPRAGADDSPSFVLREFNILAEITKDLFDRLEAVSEPTARGGLNQFTARMLAESIAGAATDSTVTGEFFCRNLQFLGNENEKTVAEFILRSNNATVIVS